MRYALGLTMIGSGALLIYSGFKNRSAWDIVRAAISPGAPTSTIFPTPTGTATTVPTGNTRGSW